MAADLRALNVGANVTPPYVADLGALGGRRRCVCESGGYEKMILGFGVADYDRF
jgi:hypothetical protein